MTTHIWELRLTWPALAPMQRCYWRHASATAAGSGLRSAWWSRNDRAYFRTYDAAGKYKRLGNFPEVRLSPSTLRGKPKGQSIEAKARLLHGFEAEHARTLLATNYPILHGRMVPWMHRRKGWTIEHYELTVVTS